MKGQLERKLNMTFYFTPLLYYIVCIKNGTLNNLIIENMKRDPVKGPFS